MSICGERQAKLASLFHQQCLKPLGYRKHGTTWNYHNESAFVYVVNFQNSIGNFATDCKLAVNFGVYLPILHDDELPEPYIKEYYCDYRHYLGTSDTIHNHWWQMADNLQQVNDELTQAFLKDGIAWFDAHATYDLLIANWETEPTEWQTVIGVGLRMAQLFAKLGYVDRSHDLFDAVARRYQIERPHALKSILEQARKCGIQLDITNTD